MVSLDYYLLFTSVWSSTSSDLCVKWHPRGWRWKWQFQHGRWYIHWLRGDRYRFTPSKLHLKSFYIPAYYRTHNPVIQPRLCIVHNNHTHIYHMKNFTRHYIWRFNRAQPIKLNNWWAAHAHSSKCNSAVTTKPPSRQDKSIEILCFSFQSAKNIVYRIYMTP